MKVAIQGELGSFSHEAAERMLRRCAVVPCARSADVFDRVQKESVEAAVIPIENTLAGTVAEHADLLVARDVFIQAEYLLRIVHNVIAAPGVPLRALRRVLSHPVALDQCRDFFRHHPQIEAVPFYDTAGSVKMLAEQKMTDAAAIASAVAAGIYGARILKRSIEDDRRNFTRFFLLRRPSYAQRHPVTAAAKRQWKTSLVFTTRNVPGALFRCMSAFALRDLNLTKIESRPMRGRPWEYVFYVDFLRGDDEPARNALRHLGEVADFVKVLGIYPSARASKP